MSGLPRVRALQRGLEILQALNAQGGLRANEVARVTGVPRPTAYRLLETLEELGFVARSPSDDTWRPTLRSKSLSSGFRDEDWVAQIAVPHMMRLGRRILWPIDLATFHDYRMVVRESTHNISPFSIDIGMVGRELPVTLTAGGRAWLAFCPEAEREQILAGLAQRGETGGGILEDRAALDFMLDRCRELGVGYRSGGFNDHTMSLSAPILQGERVVAALTVIWITSAMGFEEALTRYRSELTATASAIADELASGANSAS